MRTTGTLLILSLLALSLCGALMACLESIGHFTVLSHGALPTASVWLAALLVALVFSAVIVGSSLRPSFSARPHRRPPDLPLWRPLQSLFSDGLLNPKPF